ncbi:MAG: type II toxin-antitoxin system VapC family toxin [Rhizomicrobium sp.]
MVVDTSALTAIILGEPEEQAFVEALAGAETLRMSAGTLAELGITLVVRHGPEAERRAHALISKARIEIVPVDQAQALAIWNAYRRYGKGLSPAKLNYGDCFAYALAKSLNEPLLYKGSDFAKTDVRPAV